MNNETIDIPPAAVAVREQSQAIERANLSLDEVHEQLGFIRQIMAREMKEGQDYGKIQGCGDKPGLFQPGAQKLLLTFQLTPHVKREVLRDIPHPSIFGHREYEFTISVRSKTGREWDGVGTCSTFESKYRYRKLSRKCPKCGKESIRKDKKPNRGWYCWSKLGGCGAQFGEKAPEIVNQEEGKTDNENPAEFWNTVRKMAFKRAIVHAAINATNTSELWSQDIEDLPQAHVAPEEEYDPTPKPTIAAQKPPSEASRAPQPPPNSPPVAPKPTEAKATAKYRLQALNKLQAAPGGRNRALFVHFAMSKGWLKADQEPETWPLEFVPATAEEFGKLLEEIHAFDMAQQQPEIVP